MNPIFPASSELETQLSRDIQKAEEEAAADLLIEEKTEEQLIAVAENAAGFAEALTMKYLHPDSPPVACQQGCSWCCYQLVPVSVPETVRITAYLRNLPSPEFARIEVRLRSLDRATRGLTPQQRVGIPKECAYLENRKCTIHPVRPLACAEFTSYDVQACKRGKRLGFKPESIIHEKARMLSYYAVQEGLFRALESTIPEADCEHLELIAASVVALDNPDVVELWLEGSNVLKPAHMHFEK